jgi:putative acetyltransferase
LANGARYVKSSGSSEKGDLLLEIRAAEDKDSDEIKSVVFEVLKEYGLSPEPENTDLDLDSIEKYYHQNGGFFGVVEDDGVIVATVGIYRLDSSTCELRKMYALPNQRGKGLGKLLMEFTIKTAKELGFSRITLETATPLREAIALYQKYGFKKYDPEHMAVRCDQAFELCL